jgi:hypothetical protein
MGNSVTLYNINNYKTAADLIKCVLITLYNAGMAGILLAI